MQQFKNTANVKLDKELCYRGGTTWISKSVEILSTAA